MKTSEAAPGRKKIGVTKYCSAHIATSSPPTPSSRYPTYRKIIAREGYIGRLLPSGGEIHNQRTPSCRAASPCALTIRIRQSKLQ